MKTIVLYTSKTGNTAKYAEEIASQVGADAKPLKKFRWKKELKDYDCIVFGGWVMGGKIKGVDDFLSHYDDMHEAGKDIIVFAVGMSMPSPDGRKELISLNLLDLYRIRFYQVRGSFDMNALKFPYSTVMKATLNKMESDPNLTADKRALLELRERPLVYHDDEKVAKIVNIIKTIEEQRKSQTA